MAGTATAQVVSPDLGTSCKGSGAVIITITDSTGALIPNAFVLFRGDGLGNAKSKDFLSERRTDSTGKQIVTVPCGLLDLFATADGFAPHAEKLVIERDATEVLVKLELYPITYH
jgi:hypothetical protein